MSRSIVVLINFLLQHNYRTTSHTKAVHKLLLILAGIVPPTRMVRNEFTPPIHTSPSQLLGDCFVAEYYIVVTILQ